MATIKQLSQLALLIGAMFCAHNAFANTYYISQSTGSNSNNGLSKTTPWKSQPYMPTAAACTGTGSAPAYTHTAGDHFIFMGGDTWPNACWPMIPAAGGSAGNIDYYGVDKTWWNAGVCGASWCRPIFDGQNSATAECLSKGYAGLFAPGAFGPGGISYITADNWEVKNLYWNSCAGTSYSAVFSLGPNDCQTTIENMYVHHWTHDTLANGAGDVLNFTDVSVPAGGALSCNVQVLNNTIDNSDGSCDSGAWTSGTVIAGNIWKCTPNAILGTVWDFHDNIIENQGVSFDDGGTAGCHVCIHENGFEGWLDAGGTEYIYNNIFHDTSAHGITVFLDPAFGVTGNAPTSVYFFNNVIWDSLNANPVYVDTNCGNGITCSQNNMSIYMWNNTMDATPSSGAACIRVVNRGTGQNVGTVNVQNNQCVSNLASGTAGLISFDSGMGANTYVNVPNLVMNSSTAVANGYTPSNVYRPTSSSSPTVGAGSNLTGNCTGTVTALCSDASGIWNAVGTLLMNSPNIARPSSGNWDDGAYLFGGSSSSSAAPAAPTGLVATVQ